MAGYQFRSSGVSLHNGFNDIPVLLFFEQGLFDEFTALIEKLAVATGNMPETEEKGWLTGSFVVVTNVDRDGNGQIGMLPAYPINADTKNKPATENGEWFTPDG
jgi:hypothetical protein